MHVEGSMAVELCTYCRPMVWARHIKSDVAALVKSDMNGNTTNNRNNSPSPKTITAAK